MVTALTYYVNLKEEEQEQVGTKERVSVEESEATVAGSMCVCFETKIVHSRPKELGGVVPRNKVKIENTNVKFKLDMQWIVQVDAVDGKDEVDV